MADNDLDRNVREYLSQLEKMKEQVSAVDQARFDEAWKTMYDTIKDYLNKIVHANFDHPEASRPWHEGLAKAILLTTDGRPPQSGDEIIEYCEQVTERVRNLPDPTE